MKPKYAEKRKAVLYGYRQFHCIHKNRNYRKYIYTENVETRFHTSNYELDRPLPKGKNKMKDELVGKIMKKFVR